MVRFHGTDVDDLAVTSVDSPFDAEDRTTRTRPEVSVRALLPILLLVTTPSCSLGNASPPTSEAAARAVVGQSAPSFELTSLDGSTVSLASLKGQTVVLEWFNPDCPFVVAAHGEGGPLRDLGNTWSAKDGVTWLAINSGAPGKQGHGKERNAKAVADWSIGYPVLLDESGDVGRAYGAKTTPHLYVVDGEGILRYAGGLDDAPLGKAPEGGATPFLANAVEAVAAGRTPDPASTKPYGCSVKY